MILKWVNTVCNIMKENKMKNKYIKEYDYKKGQSIDIEIAEELENFGMPFFRSISLVPDSYQYILNNQKVKKK